MSTLRSPFAEASFEPRFVVEHYVSEAVRAAVELWWLCSSAEYGAGWRATSWLFRGADRFQARHPRAGRPYSEGWEELAEPMTTEQLTEAILSWRDGATYPEQPNFDGSEAKGFTLFWAHYGYLGQRDSGGGLIVLPKWIEIHK